MIRPQVSVVLPTRNRARTLQRAMRSVLTQTMRDLELLVVDDGSTDDTASCIAGFADQRVRVLKADLGNVAAARNLGISAARAPFIAFQDSDDEWTAQKLERQLALMHSRPELELVLCSVLRWDGKRVRALPSTTAPAASGSDLCGDVYRRNIAPPPAWLLRRECMDRVGPFDQSLPPVDDWEWLLRFCQGGMASLLDEPLVIAYESDDSVSLRHASVATALARIADRYEARLRRESGRALAELRLAAGVRACMAGDPAGGRAQFMRSLAERPFGLKAPMAWLLSLAGPSAMQAAWQLARSYRGQ
jgi:glycosyltransferase involved in cell wall biosynthesis